jgi:YHS domain-containing protein
MKNLTRCLALLALIAIVSSPILAAADLLKQVNPKNACFINKTRFNRTLKSVVVDGKKYFGCCDDCLAQLRDDPQARIAMDPVSGKSIDKAGAVIGVDKDGKVYFFENRENMRRFRPPSGIPTGN